MASDGPGVRSAVLRAVTDRFLLGQWVEASWRTSRSGTPSGGCISWPALTDELVVWSERSLFTVNSGSALAIHRRNVGVGRPGRRRGGGRRRPGDGQHLVAVVSLELHGAVRCSA